MRVIFAVIVLSVALNFSFAQLDYFPVDKGTQWTYAFGTDLYGGTPFENYTSEIRILDAVETIDGTEYFVSESATGNSDSEKTVIRSYFRFADDGSLISKVDKNAPEVVSMKKNPKVGDTYPSQQGGTSKVVDLNASIATPVKTYNNCLMIEIEENQTTSRAYYQKNVGMVATTIIADGTEKLFIYLLN